MTHTCSTCRHNPKTCTYQNYNNKCNGYQLISIEDKKKEVRRLQIEGKDWKELQKEIDGFEFGMYNDYK